MEKENKKKYEKLTLSIIGVVLLIIIITGVSYAFIMFSHTQSTNNVIKTNCLRIAFEDIDNSAINLQEVYPITDEEANNLIPYKFKIINKCDIDINYDIKLDILEDDNLMPLSYVAIKFNGENKQILNTLEEAATTSNYQDLDVYKTYKFKSDSLSANESREYTLNMWIDGDVTATSDSMNKTLRTKVNVDATIK